MIKAWPVAVITFKEGIKNRLLFGIFIIALLLFAATTMVTTFFMRDVVKVAVDFSLSTVSLSGLLMLFFVGINLYGKDIDKRTVYMVLSRPISRAEYLFGKYLGIVLLALTVTAFLSVLSSVPVLLSGQYYHLEARFNWGIFILAAVFIFFKLAVVSSVITLFASFTSNSFITLVMSLVTYIIGQSTEGIRTLVTSTLEVGEISPVLKEVVNIAYYVFPNLAAFDLKTQAAHGIPIDPSTILWTLLYAVLYMTIAITVATLAFRRREFP